MRVIDAKSGAVLATVSTLSQAITVAAKLVTADATLVVEIR